MMRGVRRLLLLCCCAALSLGLCACQEEPPRKATLDKEAAAAAVATAAAKLHAVEAPAPAAEVAAADRVLAAGNALWRWAEVADLHAGHMLRQVEDYMRTWLLGKEIRRPAELADRPVLETAVWGKDDHARLRDLVATMRRTLAEMEKQGAALRKYALDDSIVDDGVQGKKLLRRMRAAQGEFAKARDALLVLVRERGRQAEDVVLRGHPLKEAVSTARFLFSRFVLGSVLLREANPADVTVNGWRTEMEEALAGARARTRGMTPEERTLWLAFVDKAAVFPRLVAQGQEDTFSNETRRQLNLALQESQEAYNAFVAAYNKREGAQK